MRHSFATHLPKSGADTRTAQEPFGHDSVEATQGYLRAMKESGVGGRLLLDGVGDRARRARLGATR